MGFADRVLAADRSAFLAINGAHSDAADAFFWYVSDLRLWVPVYLLFLVVLQRRWGWRGLLWSVPVIAAMILLSDTGSVLLFKNTVHRLRPTHTPDLQAMVHTVNGYTGGEFGFVSSHAANHFAIAVFMMGVFQRRPKWMPVTLALWASLISYSRIYLGVHFPGDVIAGALYGALVGMLAFRSFVFIHQRAVSP